MLHRRKKILILTTALLLPLAVCTSFFPFDSSHKALPAEPAEGHCASNEPFYGYTFLSPEIINPNAAYAPFFIKWDDYYQQFYYNRDIQKEENIKEWRIRFCNIATTEDIDYVVYKSDINELTGLYNAAVDPKKKATLPYRMGGNTFAEVIAYNGCTEAVSYLMFAKRCEPYVIAQGDGWILPDRDTSEMYSIILEGIGRFKNTDSHFIRLRYAYQIIRMAHYIQDWQYTIDLYNYLMPKVDRKRYSIVFYWTLGHLAGALQKQGKYAEAAYRYSLVFRNCPSKRASAYRSFLIRNDQDWTQTLQLCQDDAERSTLYILRAGGTHRYAVQDMETIYGLDPQNPQLELLLVSDIQELEKIYLRTWVTDRKQGMAKGTIAREAAAKHLLDLQKFVRKALKDAQIPNPKLWRGLEGYLEILAGDRYGAEKTLERLKNALRKEKDETGYHAHLIRQIDIWMVLLDILNLDTAGENADNQAFKIRSFDAFAYNPNLELLLQDWLSASFATKKQPGRAILSAYPPSALGLNPSMEIYDDLLKLAEQDDPVLLEYAMQMDTNPDRIKAYLLEMKGAFLLSQGEPEAALAVMRNITPIEEARLPKFAPFKETFDEKVYKIVSDSLILNRRQIARKILDYEFKAKAASAMDDPAAAWYYYLIGVAYYNMSYFGYEWKALDNYRSGYNQLRLAQGPVFPLRGSPSGNRENIDVSLSLKYFKEALRHAKTPELAARAAFMAARCDQKRWFCQPNFIYRQGSSLIPTLPDEYATHYNMLTLRYKDTDFYEKIVKECKWFAAYARN